MAGNVSSWFRWTHGIPKCLSLVISSILAVMATPHDLFEATHPPLFLACTYTLCFCTLKYCILRQCFFELSKVSGCLLRYKHAATNNYHLTEITSKYIMCTSVYMLTATGWFTAWCSSRPTGGSLSVGQMCGKVGLSKRRMTWCGVREASKSLTDP